MTSFQVSLPILEMTTRCQCWNFFDPFQIPFPGFGFHFGLPCFLWNCPLIEVYNYIYLKMEVNGLKSCFLGYIAVFVPSTDLSPRKHCGMCPIEVLSLD